MNVLEVAVKNLEEKQAQLTEFLVGGGAKTFEHYSAIVGELKGLTYAANELKDTNNRLIKEDDDE